MCNSNNNNNTNGRKWIEKGEMGVRNERCKRERAEEEEASLVHCFCYVMTMGRDGINIMNMKQQKTRSLVVKGKRSG